MISDLSSWTHVILPEITTPTSPTWQLSPQTAGLMQADHFQPGSSTSFDAFTFPNLTTSIFDYGGFFHFVCIPEVFAYKFALLISRSKIIILIETLYFKSRQLLYLL